MIEQVEAIKNKIGSLINDLRSLSSEVEKVETRNELSLELEEKMRQKNLLLNKRAIDITTRENNNKTEKQELEQFSNKIANRERIILKKEDDIAKIYSKIEDDKKDLGKREAKIIDNEADSEKIKIEREKLEEDKSKLEIEISKLEKEKKISRIRKESLDDREKVIEEKEAALRRRLNS